MSNVLTVPASGAIYFDSSAAGSSTVPALTSGVSLNYDGGAGLNITSYNPSTSATDRFSVDGANGRLFSVSDSLTGTIFSVNDAAGLPIIEVNSTTTDVVNIGTYGTNALVVSGSNVGIGTATPTTKLDVIGSIKSSGQVYNNDSTFTYSNATSITNHRNALGLGTGDSVVFGEIAAGSTQARIRQVEGRFEILQGNIRRAAFNGSDFRLYNTIIISDGNNPLVLTAGTGPTEIRNGTNAQTFRLYNTYTSSTNFERLNFRWDSNVAKIGTEKGSASPGGTARDLVLETDGTERVRVEAAGQIITKANLRLETPSGGGSGLITTTMSNTPILTLTQSNGNKLTINPGDGNIARSTGANAALNLSFQAGGGNVGIGTTTPASKLTVTGGDIEATDSASGVILKSPDGTRYRITVTNGGALSSTDLTPPAPTTPPPLTTTPSP